MTKSQDIFNQIEKKRYELNNLAKNRQNFDKSVLSKSQELDLLLNLFDEERSNKKAQ